MVSPAAPARTAAPPTRPARRSSPRGDRHRPAAVDEVVDEQHRAGRASVERTERGEPLPDAGQPVGAVAAGLAARAAVDAARARPRYGSRPTSAMPRASESTSCGRRRDGMATTAAGRSSQPQSASTRTHAVEQARRDRARRRRRRRRASRSAPPQPRSVSRASARPSSARSPVGDVAAHGHARAGPRPTGHCARGSTGTPTRSSERSRRGGGVRRHVARVPGARAVVAAPAGRRGRRRRGRAAGTPSGTRRSARSRACAAARPRGRRRCARSARRRRSTAARSTPSRPARGAPRRRRRAP